MQIITASSSQGCYPTRVLLMYRLAEVHTCLMRIWWWVQVVSSLSALSGRRRREMLMQRHRVRFWIVSRATSSLVSKAENRVDWKSNRMEFNVVFKGLSWSWVEIHQFVLGKYPLVISAFASRLARRDPLRVGYWASKKLHLLLEVFRTFNAATRDTSIVQKGMIVMDCYNYIALERKKKLRKWRNHSYTQGLPSFSKPLLSRSVYGNQLISPYVGIGDYSSWFPSPPETEKYQATGVIGWISQSNYRWGMLNVIPGYHHASSS